MKKAVFLAADGGIKVVDFPEDAKLEYFCKGIGCDMIEIVRTDMMPENLVFVVDEEGLLKDNPIINTVASGYYGAMRHGDVIVGNAIVVSEENGPEGGELVGLDEETANKYAEIFKTKLEYWKFPIMLKLYGRWEGA